MPAPPGPDNPLGGSCLCGAVTFVVSAPFRRASHCHCLRGDRLRVYRPEGGAAKAFCAICGSSLFGGTWPDGDEVSVRLGALDGDPGIRPQYHSFCASRAGWDALPDDGLPRHDGASPAG